MGSGMIRIDDSTPESEFLNPTVDDEVMRCSSKGLWSPRNGTSPALAGRFEDLKIPIIPESEWGRRRQKLEDEKATLPDFADKMGMKIRNQENSNYCWVFGTCRSAEYAILKTGVNIHISPFSVGAPATGFRNVGGWGDKALARLGSSGFNTEAEWPSNGSSSINRRYYNEKNKRLAAERKVVEFYELESGRAGWAQVVSCILAGIPVAVGFNWWRHLVCATFLSSNMDLGIDNSWGTGWSDNGRGLISGNRKYADGAVAVVAAQAL